jgi:hypothetical protein
MFPIESCHMKCIHFVIGIEIHYRRFSTTIWPRHEITAFDQNGSWGNMILILTRISWGRWLHHPLKTSDYPRRCSIDSWMFCRKFFEADPVMWPPTTSSLLIDRSIGRSIHSVVVKIILLVIQRLFELFFSLSCEVYLALVHCIKTEQSQVGFCRLPSGVSDCRLPFIV